MQTTVEIWASEIEGQLTPSGMTIADAGFGTVEIRGSEDEIVGALRRIADLLGKCGYTVEARDPGPDRYNVKELITGEWGLYDGGAMIGKFFTPEAAHGLADAMNK